MFSDDDNYFEEDLRQIRQTAKAPPSHRQYRPDAEMAGTGFEWIIPAAFISVGIALAVGLGYLSSSWLVVFGLIPLAELNRRRLIRKRTIQREKHYRDYNKSLMEKGDPRFWGRGLKKEDSNNDR